MNRFRSKKNDVSAGKDPQELGPQPIGKVLADLLAAYQVRFPEIRITIVETPGTAMSAA